MIALFANLIHVEHWHLYEMSLDVFHRDKGVFICELLLQLLFVTHLLSLTYSFLTHGAEVLRFSKRRRSDSALSAPAK